MTEPDGRSAQPAPDDRPVTGDRAADEAIARLDALGELPVTEHVRVFDDAHRILQDALADLDEE